MKIITWTWTPNIDGHKDHLEIALISAIGIIFLWYWSTMGKRPSRIRSWRTDIIKEFRRAAWICYGICLFLVFAPFLNSSPYPNLAPTLGCALVFLLYSVLIPKEYSFWHLPRRRTFTLSMLTGCSLIMGFFMPFGELIAMVFAAMIFQKHRRGETLLLMDNLEEIGRLTQKLISKEARGDLFSIINQANATGKSGKKSSLKPA